MARYQTPRCVGELPGGRLCNNEMRVLGERHPYAQHYRQSNMHVFQCGYCGAIQAMDDDKLDRMLLRT